MTRELFLHVLRKTKLVTLLSVVLMSVAGIFIQHTLLSVNAAKAKWKFCERFDGDWYSYVSKNEIGQTDKLQKELQENARVYTIDDFYVKGDYSAYQYSEEAWTFFNYPLKEGEGFGSGKTNQVVVSEGMSHQYPVGATIDITFYSAPLQEEGTFTFEVAGVLAQEEIVIPHNTTTGALLWNTDETYSEMTRQSKFVLLNPKIQLEQKDKCVLSQGMFFDRSSLESEEWMERLAEKGTLVSMREAYENSGKERSVSLKEGIKGGVFLLMAAASLLVWITVVAKKSEEDICYLLQVGFSRRKLFGYLIRMTAVFLFLAYLLSFVAYFLPNQYEDTWEMTVSAPFAALAGYLFVWVINAGVSYLFMRGRSFRTAKRILCIEDMTLLDNIRLYLLMHGYSVKASATVASTLLEEKEIVFCSGRKMGNLAMEQLICFDEIVSQ